MNEELLYNIMILLPICVPLKTISNSLFSCILIRFYSNFHDLSISFFCFYLNQLDIRVDLPFNRGPQTYQTKNIEVVEIFSKLLDKIQVALMR